MSQPSFQLSPRKAIEIVLRHKKKILICPLLAIAFGAIVLVFWPRTYRSEARILLRVGRESVGLDPTVTTGQTLTLGQADRKDEVRSAIEVLRSQSIAARVVDELGVDVVLGRSGPGATEPNPLMEIISLPLQTVVSMVRSIDPISDREEAINQIEKNLRAAAERESTLIVVQYEAKTPKFAQMVCDAVVRVFEQEHMRIHRSAASRPFFDDQQERLRKQLDESMDAVRLAKNEMGLSGVDERRATLEAQFSAVELERLSTSQQLATAKARIENLQHQLVDLPERLVGSKKSVPNQGADLLRQQLYALQMKSMDLQARYNDSHPLVQAANNQVAEAKQVLGQEAAERTETTDDLNPIYRQLSLDLKKEQSIAAGHEARLAELSRQKETVLTDLRAVNNSDLKIDQLTRHADLARDKFFQYSRAFEETRIDSELELDKISNLSKVQPAMLSEKPATPSRILVLLGTFMLATCGTAGLVILSEMLDARLRTNDDVERALGLPVLGSIPGDASHSRVLSLKTNGALKSPVLK